MEQKTVQAGEWIESSIILSVEAKAYEYKKHRDFSYYLPLAKKWAEFHKLKKGDLLHIVVKMIERSKA